MQHFLQHFMSTGGGLAVIVLASLLAAGWLTSYRPEDIPEKYR